MDLSATSGGPTARMNGRFDFQTGVSYYCSIVIIALNIPY